MTNEDDMTIREAAREICAAQAKKSDFEDYKLYLSGVFDDYAWMRLVEQGIRKGIEIGRSL